ncbi:MAG: hypothetical protein LBM96_07880 [Methanobrevibacter sp.]|nr:hypothetical protein [Candidatus Methanoflexus mossambicus]
MNLSIILILLSFFATYFIPWKFSELLFFIFILIFSFFFYRIKDCEKYIENNENKENNDKNNIKENNQFNYNITLFSWFFIYLLFFTTRITKVDRYFLAFLPPFIFIVLFFINSFSEELNNWKPQIIKKISFKRITIALKHVNFRKIVPILLIILFLISTVNFLIADRHQPIVDNEKDTVLWLKNYDPDYKYKVLSSDTPFFAFYLEKEVNLKFKTGRSNEIGDILKNKNVTYYIATRENANNTITGYRIIKNIGQVYVFKNIS